MRNLLRCRRGSAAFATVIALVPLIGVVALGGEAGSWYVTKQHAQNAADAAAYSGGLVVACSLSGACADTHDYVYRGKEFAAQNSFCNAGDTSYPGATCASSLPTNVSQTVAMDRGTWAGGAWTSSANGAFVRAQVSQQQPAYLAAVLGLTTVNIPTQAIAQVKIPCDSPMRFGLERLPQFPGQPEHQCARMHVDLERYGQQCPGLHRRRDELHFRNATRGDGGVLRFIDTLWRFKRKDLPAAGHRSILCSRWRPHQLVRFEHFRHLRSVAMRRIDAGRLHGRQAMYE